jgi:menaquinone-9 beta-reductase
MTGERVWDAVVVGGGPAGAATAARLADRGHAVLLLDRAEFPRPKPCGECLNPAAVRALADLGVLERVRAAGGVRLDGWQLHPVRGPSFRGTFPAAAPGLMIARTTLDPVLLDHARQSGAEVRMGVRVADVLRDGERVTGVRTSEGEIHARLVVGADGLRSVVVRRLGLLRRTPRLRKVALAAHVHGLPPLEGRGTMHLLPHGCLGVAEVAPGVANVVLVVEGEEAAGVAGNREAYFDAALRGVPALAGARRAEPVRATGPFDWPTRRAVAPGALLVGDAAGYYDPFTGQGIFRALRGAEMASDTADAALRRDDLSAAALAPYERARRGAFAPGERVQRLIEHALARPRFFAAVAGRFARRPALADALVAVTGDIRPVRSLLAPRVLAEWI